MKETKAARHERLRKDEARAIRAMHCDGCPYRTCLGATATLSWDEMTERARGEDSQEKKKPAGFVRKR